MGNTYLRAGVILLWALGVNAKAFKIQVEGYAGDDETRPGSYNYGVYGGGLLRVLGRPARTRKLPTRGAASSVRAHTLYQRRMGDPVE